MTRPRNTDAQLAEIKRTISWVTLAASRNGIAVDVVPAHDATEWVPAQCVGIDYELLSTWGCLRFNVVLVDGSQVRVAEDRIRPRKA